MLLLILLTGCGSLPPPEAVGSDGPLAGLSQKNRVTGSWLSEVKRATRYRDRWYFRLAAHRPSSGTECRYWLQLAIRYDGPFRDYRSAAVSGEGSRKLGHREQLLVGGMDSYQDARWESGFLDLRRADLPRDPDEGLEFRMLPRFGRPAEVTLPAGYLRDFGEALADLGCPGMPAT